MTSTNVVNTWNDVTSLKELSYCCHKYVEGKIESPYGGFFQDSKYDQDIIHRCNYLIDKRNCYVISAKTPVFSYGIPDEENDDKDSLLDIEEKSVIKMFIDSKSLRTL